MLELKRKWEWEVTPYETLTGIVRSTIFGSVAKESRHKRKDCESQ